MKHSLSILRRLFPRAWVVAGVVLCPAAFLLALPNQVFMGNGFLGAAGMSFEDFIAGTDAWGRVAALKGDWVPAATKGPRQTLRLAQTAVVFGLPAKEVTVDKENGLLVLATVRYVEEKKDAGNLAVRLRRAIAAWAGVDFADGVSTLEAKGLSLEVSGTAKEAAVVVRRAAAR